MNGEPLGPLTFTYSYRDGDGNWVPTGDNGNDPPVDPGYYKAVGSYAGNDTYPASSATAGIAIAYDGNILTDLSRAFHAGRTIPIKLQLTDAGGNNLSSSSIGVTAIRLELETANGPVDVALRDAGNANPNNLFRYDAGLGDYVFNLSTRGLAAGTYDFFWTADGYPTDHALNFRLI